MRTLAIETATEACSLALFEGGELLAHEHCVLGRGHAERLVPMIAALPERGKADRIIVSLGPGSFTGVRIGIATARALGIAWSCDVVGYPTLALVAAHALHCGSSPTLAVAANGGHGEWFLQRFSANGLPLAPPASLTPQAAASTTPDHLVAGNRAQQLVDLRGSGAALPLLPDARHVWRLPASLRTNSLAPIYGRPPDARAPS